MASIDQEKYRSLFIEQGTVHLDAISDTLLRLEREPSHALIDDLHRHIHTLKSMAQAVNATRFASVAHAFETKLAHYKTSQHIPACGDMDVLLQAVDGMRHRLQSFRDHAAPLAEDAAQDEALLRQLDEPGAVSPLANAAVIDAAPLSAFLPTTLPTSPPTTLPAPPASPITVSLPLSMLDGWTDDLGELFALRDMLSNETEQGRDMLLGRIGSRIRRLHDRMLQARLLSFGTLATRYRRIVRDLARGLGKRVRFELQDNGIALDRTILDALDAPMMHALRNALDHGIEAPEERLAQHKEQEASLCIRASRAAGFVQVDIEDDGRGIDLEKIKAVALSRGLVTQAQLQGSEARDILHLIFLPGLSTKSQPNTLSGRGVGMDVVRQQIDDLGGTVSIQSSVGRGTCLTLRLPLQRTIGDVLLVQIDGQRFAVPLAHVVCVPYEPPRRVSSEGEPYIAFEGAYLPLHELADILQLPRSRKSKMVIVETVSGRCALAVENVLGLREAVVKPLQMPLNRVPCFAGAAFVGDGTAILVLDILQTFAIPRGTHAATTQPTTRTVEGA